MRIVIDTREQEPYSFIVPVIRHKLDAGDYSVEGFETRVAVERKSLPDFVNTVIRQRRRFHAELIRLRGYDAACVVVECAFRDIVDGKYRADVHSEPLPPAPTRCSAPSPASYLISTFQCSSVLTDKRPVASQKNTFCSFTTGTIHEYYIITTEYRQRSVAGLCRPSVLRRADLLRWPGTHLIRRICPFFRQILCSGRLASGHEGTFYHPSQVR